VKTCRLRIIERGENQNQKREAPFAPRGLRREGRTIPSPKKGISIPRWRGRFLRELEEGLAAYGARGESFFSRAGREGNRGSSLSRGRKSHVLCASKGTQRKQWERRDGKAAGSRYARTRKEPGM